MNDTWRPSSLWRPESYGKRCLLSVASAVSKFSLPASTWKALSTLRPFLGGQLRHQSSTNSWCSQWSPPKSPFKLKSLHGVPQTTFGIFQKSRRHAHVRRSPRRASSPPPDLRRWSCRSRRLRRSSPEANSSDATFDPTRSGWAGSARRSG